MKPSASARGDGAAHCSRALWADRRGVAALEFAMVAPLLFILLFGIIQIGLAGWRISSVQWATERAARAAMLDGTLDADSFEALLTEELRSAGVTADLQLVYEEVEMGGVTVARVTGEHRLVIDIPLLSAFPVSVPVETVVPRPD